MNVQSAVICNPPNVTEEEEEERVVSDMDS